MKLEELLSQEELELLRSIKDKTPIGEDKGCLEVVTRDVPQEQHDKN